MSTEQNVAPNLVKAAQAQVKLLTEDLRDRSESTEDPWAKELRKEYDQARKRERTALSWSEWRDGEVDLATKSCFTCFIFCFLNRDRNQRWCHQKKTMGAPKLTDYRLV